MLGRDACHGLCPCLGCTFTVGVKIRFAPGRQTIEALFGFTFSSLERSTDNSIDSVTVRIDNIDMRWAVVANTYILNNTDVEIWEAFRDSLADGEDGAKL